MSKAHTLVTGCQEILLKKARSQSENIPWQRWGGQQDFPVKPTRLTPETELGVSKAELSLEKSSQWDAFSQVENKQPLDRGIVSPSWTLALLPISCTNLVQPEKQPGWKVSLLVLPGSFQGNPFPLPISCVGGRKAFSVLVLVQRDCRNVPLA